MMCEVNLELIDWMTVLFFLGVSILCVESIPSAFVVTSIGKEVFNSLGVFWFVECGKRISFR